MRLCFVVCGFLAITPTKQHSLIAIASLLFKRIQVACYRYEQDKINY